MADHPLTIPDYLLEQYALGELSSEEMQRLDRRAEENPALRARLAALRASNEGILAAHPPGEFARAVDLRARGGATAASTTRPHRPRASRWMILAPAMAAVVLLAFVLVKQNPVPWRGSDSAGNASSREVTREKGRPALRIYRRSRAGVDTLRDNAVAACGDVLQLSYVPFGRLHGVIVSLDGRGAVTLHFPAGPERSTQLDLRGETLLPHAYELDDAPDFERFFLVTSSGPIDVPAVLSAARDLARSRSAACLERLPLPSRLEQTSFLVRKRGSSL